MTRLLIGFGLLCLFVYGFAKCLRTAMAAYVGGE